MDSRSVLIIGAGAAGLAAARDLGEGGCRVEVLEARERVGGRILTVHDRSVRIPMELGAEFIHGMPESTWEVVKAAGLTAYAVPFEHMARDAKGKLVQFPHYSRDLKEAMDGLKKLGRRDMSFADYLRRRQRGAGLTRGQRLAVDFVEGFDAADTERISARSLADEQEGLGDVEEEPQFRLLDGYGAVIDHLRQSLDARCVRVHLGKKVSEVCWKKSHAEVRCGVHGEIFQGRRVLITLPLGILQLPPESPGSVRFAPDISDKRHALSLLASGPVIKVILKFSEAFWEGLGESVHKASFIHDMALAIPTWWTARPMHLAVLTGWVGGPKAVKLAGLVQGDLRRVAIQSVARLLNQSSARVNRGVEQCYSHDWPADPYARGAYSYVAVGGNNVRAALGRPISDTLFFAGEATDDAGQASTVAGALASGRRAARELLNTL